MPSRPRMLVTGGSGFLGRHLCRHAADAGWQVVAPSSTTMDVTQPHTITAAVDETRPDAVVHLAYRKGNRTVIVDGSRNVADAAQAAGARMVHMSTDVVFAGRSRPYTESDLPDPVIDYGRDKADAELAVRAASSAATIMRTSLLYGTDVLSPAQVELADLPPAGTPAISFFTDEYRCPAHAGDVAEAILRILSGPAAPPILHVAGPEVVSRFDYARALADHAGRADVRLRASTIAASGMTRSARVVLDTSLASSIGIACRRLETALQLGA